MPCKKHDEGITLKMLWLLLITTHKVWAWEYKFLRKKHRPSKAFCSKCNNKIHWMLNLHIWNFKESTQCVWMNKKPWKVTMRFEIQQKSPIVMCVNCEQANSKKTNQQNKNKMQKPSGTCQMLDNVHKLNVFKPTCSKTPH